MGARGQSILMLTFLLLCRWSAATCQPVRGEVADTGSTTWQMGEVVVSAAVSGFIPSLSISLRDEEIRERGAGTVAELLQSESGIMISTGAKAESEFRIRGFPANASVILLDGHPLNAGYYGKVDLSLLAIAPVASLRVIKGPSSVVHGSSAMGGVVHLTTKQARASSTTSINVEAGDLAYRRLGIHHGQRSHAWSYAFTLFEHSRDGYPLSADFEPRSLEDGGTRDNSAQRMYGGQCRIGLDASESERYSLHAGAHITRRAVPATIYASDTPTWRRFPEMYRYNVSISGQRALTSTIQLSALFYGDLAGDNLIEYRSKEMDPGNLVFDSRMDNSTLGGRVLLRSSVSQLHDISAGFHYKHDIVLRQPNTDRAVMTHRYTSGGAFIEDVFRPWSRAVVTAGISQLILTHPTANTMTWEFCPMLGVTQNIIADMHINAGISRVIRFPSAQQLFSEGSGNPDLRSETAWKAEAGLVKSLNSAEADLAMEIEAVAHWSEIENLIDRASSAHRYRNVETGRLYGLELRGRFRIGAWLEADVSFDHLVRDQHSIELLRNVAPVALRNALQLHVHPVKLRHEFSSFDARTTLRSDGLMLAAHSMHNIIASVDMPAGVTLRLRVQNVFDEDIQEEFGYPAPGRMIIFGVSWSN